MLNPTEEKPIYLRHSDHRMKWSGQEQKCGSPRKIFFLSIFLALRIDAEILLSQRVKRLERKPAPKKGNALAKSRADLPTFL